MREKEFLSTIENIIGNKYIGDDCANLTDLGIVITQDSLVEGVHFLQKFISPFQLGYKSVAVNLSDIASSGAEAKYLTIALSLPSNMDNDFVEEFYKGVNHACGKNITVVGGDITACDKVVVSVCAIGKTVGRNISSRANAKVGYKIVVCGEHGSSDAGLKILNKSLKCSNDIEKTFVKSHLEPNAQIDFGRTIGEKVKEHYAMMDTSDGLMDAFYTISQKSNVLLEVDFSKIPYNKDIECFPNWQDMVLFGGEDYGLVAVIPKDYDVGGFEVGEVKSGFGVDLLIDGITVHYTQKEVENKLFNHFKS